MAKFKLAIAMTIALKPDTPFKRPMLTAVAGEGKQKEISITATTKPLSPWFLRLLKLCMTKLICSLFPFGAPK